jgi:hypothetical protein
MDRIHKVICKTFTTTDRDTLKAWIGFLRKPESAPDFPKPPRHQDVLAITLIKTPDNFLQEVLALLTMPCP